ncbi:response regulator [Spirochaeta cellobiosiphila]|uniref:response regulator n=1 Tax=Spirochaeta cellobiosiphila TaxID=504483 RepID=UPI0003FF772C|nr:response regulator [Spirochaeta cellobiosiphila]
MRILVAEDDFGSQQFMKELLTTYGEVDLAENGEEAVNAFQMAWQENIPYDVVFMDIMMPEKTGHEAIQDIRNIEQEMKIHQKDEVKIIMSTVLDDPKNVVKAYHKGGATSYMVKPVDKDKIESEMQKIGFVPLYE